MSVHDIMRRLYGRPPRPADEPPGPRSPPLPPLRWTVGEQRSIEVVQLLPAAIHEGVRVIDLARALNAGGITFSNVEGVGLVIHAIEQDPRKPAPSPPEVSA